MDRTHAADPAARLHQVVAPTAHIEPRQYAAEYVALHQIRGTMVREGDVVLLAGAHEHPGGWIRGRWARLPRAEYSMVCYALDRLLVDVHDGDRLRRYMEHPQSRQGRDASRVIVARPLGSRASEPIMAATDAVALFELLASVGCRLPVEGER